MASFNDLTFISALDIFALKLWVCFAYLKSMSMSRCLFQQKFNFLIHKLNVFHTEKELFYTVQLTALFVQPSCFSPMHKAF